MKTSFVSAIWLVSATFASQLQGNIQPFGLRFPLPPPEEGDGILSISKRSANNLTGTAFFEQLLDHDDPSKGTFQQQYWWNATTWAGPGSPVVFFTPGEVAAAGYTGYITNRTLSGVFAQEIKGAVVMLERKCQNTDLRYLALKTYRPLLRKL